MTVMVMGGDSIIQDAAATGAKRSRVLHQKQSKYGCRTCKERKVRCDQEVPSCMRCQKAGRTCGGYDRLSKSQGALYQTYVGVRKSPDTLPGSHPQHHMVRLAVDLFTFDPHRLHDKVNAEIFQALLPQLAFSRSYVGAAAAAFGAAYDMSVIRRFDTNIDSVLHLYLVAIREIRDELQTNKLELVPMLMATFLLAAAESVQQQHHIAFNHVAGAFGMATLPTDRIRPHHAMKISQTFGFGSLLSLFFSLDVQISHFTNGRIPGFPPLPIDDYMRDPVTVEHLLAAHPVMHQHCLHFIGNAAHSLCRNPKCTIHKLHAEQSDLIAWIKRWLATYDLILKRPETTIPRHHLQHLQVLKAQSLTALISTSNVLPETQCSYDAYSHHFDEIIALAESIIDKDSPLTPSHKPVSSTKSTPSPSTTPSSSTTQPSTSPKLTPMAAVPGIIHPLFHTARKYRHPLQRRRAVSLLARAGIEGPLHGPCEAFMASHIIALEEDGASLASSQAHNPQSVNLPPHLRYPTPTAPPPENRRICVAWLVHKDDLPAGTKKGIWGSTFPANTSFPSTKPSATIPAASTSRASSQQSASPPSSSPSHSPFWRGSDPSHPHRRWLRVSRRHRGPLGRGWGGEEVPAGPEEVAEAHNEGLSMLTTLAEQPWVDWTREATPYGGEIRMLDGDGVRAWGEVLGAASAGGWRERRAWGGVESVEL